LRDTTALVSGIITQEANKPVEVYDVYLDDQTLHFAAFDRDLSFFDPDGDAQTYTALGISRNPIKTSAETKVDSCSIRLDNVNRAMSSYIASTEFRGRKIVLRKIFADVSGTWTKDDDIYLSNGIMDKPVVGEGAMEIGCVSRAGTFELECPKRSFTLLCPWKFASSGCVDGLSAATLYNLQSGTVTAGSTTSVIKDSNRSEATNYWRYGEVSFTSGDNDGEKRNVETNTANDSFEVDIALDDAPDTGDTYEIKRGCDKTITRCSGLSNSSAFGGFFTLPTQMVYRT